jgi:hypothetical protein
MPDLKNPTIIWTKGLLFRLLGVIASVLLLIHTPSLRVAVLLCLTIWSFCRFYYFAFYVIEHYVDSRYQFSGLWSFSWYILRKRRGDTTP